MINIFYATCLSHHLFADTSTSSWQLRRYHQKESQKMSFQQVEGKKVTGQGICFQAERGWPGDKGDGGQVQNEVSLGESDKPPTHTSFNNSPGCSHCHPRVLSLPFLHLPPLTSKTKIKVMMAMTTVPISERTPAHSEHAQWPLYEQLLT